MDRRSHCTRWVWGLLFAGFLASLTATPATAQTTEEPATPPPTENPFPGRFPAPSLDGGTAWLNTSGPISLKELRGKIVLLDFWTYCCINCIHVLPDLKYLEEKYADQLVVIGVHAAKFDNEKVTDNIRDAILRYEIAHPVVNDSNMTIARKYFFSSWPTLVLIDPEGNFVGRQPGEGNRELFDRVIGKMVEYHRAKGTLDETPIRFDLEREKEAPTPLRYPGKVLADEAGSRLFISDSNHNRIIITSPEGKLIDVIGTGAIGAKDGGYDVATFDHPQGMTLVGNTLYVADTENHLIRTIDLEAKQVATLAGTGVQARRRIPGGPLRETALNSPWDLIELDGVLYIAMAGPHQLWKHDLGSNTVEVYAGSGREDILDGPRLNAALAQPSGLTTDGKVLYLVDSEGSAVRRVELGPEGSVTTLVGPHDLPQGRSLFTFDDVDGVGDEVRLQHPIGLVYHEGSIYVADSYNHKVKKVDVKERAAHTWIGTGSPGTSLDPVELNEPAGMTVSGNQLIVADTNNHRLLAVDLVTKETREFVIEGLAAPTPTTEAAEDETASLPITEVPAQQLASTSSARVKMEFRLPEGFKLNQLAPVVYRVESPASSANFVAAEVLGKRKRAESDEVSASFEIPLTGAGQGPIDIIVSYQFCRDGTGGVCRFATQKWRVPLETGVADGKESITLIATP